jgi:hypothetical protein
VILALTANGPGEFAGWVRPLLAELYASAPETDVRLFFVPDDYATGQEAAVARALFPAAHVYAPRDYLRFALGRPLAGLPARADRVQYLGGDLMHAARVHKRLGGVATSYKFSRKTYRTLFARVFAVDEKNRRTLAAGGTPDERISVIGNLAIDGALADQALTAIRRAMRRAMGSFCCRVRGATKSRTCIRSSLPSRSRCAAGWVMCASRSAARRSPPTASWTAHCARAATRGRTARRRSWPTGAG